MSYEVNGPVVESLPPFRPGARCSKCDCPTVLALGCDGRDTPEASCRTDFSVVLPAGPHIHRVCRECHYTWYESAGADEEE